MQCHVLLKYVYVNLCMHVCLYVMLCYATFSSATRVMYGNVSNVCNVGNDVM